MGNLRQFKLRIVGIGSYFAPTLWRAVEGKALSTLVRLAPNDPWMPIDLVPEPTNANDPNAMEIYIPSWVSLDGVAKKLGYCPRNMAPMLHEVRADSTIFAAALNTTALINPEDRPVWSARLQTDTTSAFTSPLTEAELTSPFPRCLRDLSGDPNRPRAFARLVHDWF